MRQATWRCRSRCSLWYERARHIGPKRVDGTSVQHQHAWCTYARPEHTLSDECRIDKVYITEPLLRYSSPKSTTFAACRVITALGHDSVRFKWIRLSLCIDVRAQSASCAAGWRRRVRGV